VELPERAEFWYELVNGLSAGFVDRVWGMRYARDSMEFPDFPGMVDPYLVHSDITLGAGIRYIFDNRLKVAVEGGYAVNQILRVIDGSVDRLKLDPANSPFIRGIISLGGDL